MLQNYKLSQFCRFFSNFLFANLFSIKFLYFFIILFNLFVSIFIQSYVNIKLHVSTLTNNPQGMKLCRFKNRTSARFGYIYCTLFPLCHSNQDMYPFLKDASFRSCFCFVHTIAQFSRNLRFSHIYCQIFRRVPFVNESDGPLNSKCITSTIGSEKFQTFIILVQYFEIMTKRKRNMMQLKQKSV